MKKVSRRELAKEATRQLLHGAKTDDVMRHVAAYMIEHKMIQQASALLNDIAIELESATGQVSATVRSAFGLSPRSQDVLKKYITETTHAKSVELTTIEDLSLLGGVVVRTPEREYDASVRHKLNQLARGES